jgi:glycosyltransferase involved in cell wall biosynthesis
LVTVVLPVYNERENLRAVVEELAEVLRARPHEIVAVDDGSTDGSLAVLRELSASCPALRVIELERHAGQSAALAAGFEAARGTIVVTMDADGQYDPRDAAALADRLDRHPEFAAVIGYRQERQDGWWKALQGRVGNAVRNFVTGDAVRDTGCSLKALRREMVERLPRFDGMHRFLPTLVRREGGRVAEVAVAHRARRFGRSKYGMWRRAYRGASDVLGVRWLLHRALPTGRRRDHE